MSKGTAVLGRASEMALTTPHGVEINIPELVKMFCLKKQDEHGKTTLATHKGKQSVFAQTCGLIKSMRGMAKEQQLPDETAREIRDAVDAFVRGQFEGILAEYDRFNITRGGLKAAVSKDGNSVTHEAFATIRASRDTRNSQESALADLITIGGLETRMNRVLDNPERYENPKVIVAKLQRDIDKLRKDRAHLLNPKAAAPESNGKAPESGDKAPEAPKNGKGKGKAPKGAAAA